MKLNIPLNSPMQSNSGHSGEGQMSYAQWQDKMEKTQSFAKFERVDSNTVAAYDKDGNVLDTYTNHVANRGATMQPVDTLDSKQASFPSDKTENDIDAPTDLEEGA
jgi:hypothetical protein